MVCVYDSPTTMHREAYQNGNLVASISCNLMMSKGSNGHRNMFFGLNIGERFVSGQVVGDAGALPAGGDQ